MSLLHNKVREADSIINNFIVRVINRVCVEATTTPVYMEAEFTISGLWPSPARLSTLVFTAVGHTISAHIDNLNNEEQKDRYATQDNK